jgi:hypothetical protein
MYMLFFTVGVVIGIIISFLCDDQKLANNQTKSNLLKQALPKQGFYSVSAFFKT